MASLGDVIELPIAWDLDSFNLRGGAYPEALQGTWVTKGYVEGFGVQPAFGRGFLPSDFETGRPNVALISHRLWQSRFGGDPAVIGRSFVAYVNDRPDEVEAFEVAGVLPERHWHLNAFTEILAPLRAPTYPYIVRLREGVPPAIAADRISALVRTGNSALPADWRVELVSTHGSYVQQIRPLLLAVATATALVLLIACANVAVLLTVRATAPPARDGRAAGARRDGGADHARSAPRNRSARESLQRYSALAFAWVDDCRDRTRDGSLPRPPGTRWSHRPHDDAPTSCSVRLPPGCWPSPSARSFRSGDRPRTPVSLAITGGQKGAHGRTCTAAGPLRPHRRSRSPRA